MENRVRIANLDIAKSLHDLVADDIVPGLDGVDSTAVWEGLQAIITDLAPENRSLLEKRERIQQQLNDYHKQQPGAPEPVHYKKFLHQIGYLVEEGGAFSIETAHVDDEIATIPGAQLVVPVNNARYALNAANARWGSLYDALYGTDAITEEGGLEKGSAFNQKRGIEVVRRALGFLDQAAPLDGNSWQSVDSISIDNSNNAAGKLLLSAAGVAVNLQDNQQFAGYRQEDDALIVLLKNHGLHIELHVQPDHSVGSLHPAGIKDVVLESAVTTIQDCEDSVAAVDAEDKVQVYRNWLGLMRGDLEERFSKNGKEIVRQLKPDREYTSPQGQSFTLPGRSTMLVRNVGHLMATDAVTVDGQEIPEGILDAMLTSLISMHDLQGKGRYQNSQKGSVYIVKPKMHGPEEVAFANKLFNRVEDALGLDHNTLKIGIMDEERRTTVNLKECIRAARERVIFINTGFLDRTGDEIHTSMEAGAFLPKGDIKNQPWIKAYEDWNVDIGLACGFSGKAQIGKGMWAIPDQMRQMIEDKIVHPQMGANCAWVPSPTAATLHAMHYHQVDVLAQQQLLSTRERASLDDILTIPLLGNRELSNEQIQQELDNNAQGILGYVVRWIDHGVGCSKVPDINDVGLMEDRATLRISSQHMANWLHHGICTEQQVTDTFRRMAKVVDEQNASDPFYRPMAPDYDGVAFQAALDLVLKGYQQPSGYTEPLLHAWRKAYKGNT